jgi:hypothetical protein
MGDHFSGAIAAEAIEFSLREHIAIANRAGHAGDGGGPNLVQSASNEISAYNNIGARLLGEDDARLTRAEAFIEFDGSSTG